MSFDGTQRSARRARPRPSGGAATGAALFAAVVVACAGCGERAGVGGATPAASASAAFHGADITGADFAKSLALPDVDGRMRTLDDFRGKVTVVFFGYTQCPDVCPTTMAEVAQIKKSLGADGERLQAVFVTVDPERDTPSILKSYVASFDPGFVALRGTPAQTEAAAKAFKVYYAKVPGKAEGSYTMDHSAGSYLLDAKGRPRVFERYGAGSDGLEADIRALIAQG